MQVRHSSATRHALGHRRAESSEGGARVKAQALRAGRSGVHVSACSSGQMLVSEMTTCFYRGYPISKRVEREKRILK